MRETNKFTICIKITYANLTSGIIYAFDIYKIHLYQNNSSWSFIFVEYIYKNTILILSKKCQKCRNSTKFFNKIFSIKILFILKNKIFYFVLILYIIPL